ncbi:UDP-2,4-diacetamido-2,4,6-trideoxy-beta-L-altropyranose hydrolase [Clostridium puniceum]|uniref:UDP-2,4-diacetamido-2,4, 6-trideoxy-beta-L-altropyranose hydrolase n=1 Tax=Clostridium puniceum TaxID=29367 RepID=A0A1S8TC48_9CLOT|nr:UDP-2,4-diacetamido-2,4,6-trideoxy-beta-L-altropyranose hydrolase [Clostridium puniceum]OOM75015.1 UDP-2,4-diacetamido-2,4,6-trideoxy-beta-L-altropyranose hydrolase [Clostridium puniceum]
MRIFIRADGGNTIGLGHIMRMLVLAKELKKNNEVIFLCRGKQANNINKKSDINKGASTYNSEDDKFKAGIEKVRKNEFKVFMINDECVVEEIINLQNEYKADLIITDSYDVDELYFNTLKPYFKLNGYVDDMNKCKMNVDFIINQNINAEDMNYINNVEHNTKLFLGTKYCMLRDEFRKEISKKELRGKCEDLLLTLGGMDENFNTLTILNEIANCYINIRVVIGSAFNKKLINELYDLSIKHNNIKIYENAKMSSLMVKCDVAISAGGSTLYELCAMNVPTIGIIIAENQEQVALKMKEEGLIADAYWINEIKEKKLSTILNKLINDKKIREDIIIKQRKVVNTEGVKLLADEINALIKNCV